MAAIPPQFVNVIVIPLVDHMSSPGDPRAIMYERVVSEGGLEPLAYIFSVGMDAWLSV